MTCPVIFRDSDDKQTHDMNIETLVEVQEEKKGVGHQVSEDLKKLEAVKATLNEAAMILGFPSEHVELSRLINAAIEEANSLAGSADDYLESYR